MSIKCMNYVWEHSPTTGADRLMLLALADSCNDDGEWSPGVSRLADKCQVSERAAQYTLRRLADMGEVEILHQQGFKTKTGHTNKYVMRRYRLQVGLDKGVQHTASFDNDGVKPIAPRKHKGVKPIAPVGVQPIAPESSVLPTSNTLTTRSDQGEGSKIVASPPPTAAPVSHRKMGSDDYDHPITATAPTPPVASPPPKRTDGRKFVGGFIPAGKGTNPVEIWYESFSVQDQETRLTAPDEDDLRHCTDLAKLRNVIATFRKQGFKRKKNIQLILEWYRDGIPAKYIGESNERSHNGSGGAKRPVGTAQQPHPAMQWGTADPNDPF